jgi:amino acid transporter
MTVRRGTLKDCMMLTDRGCYRVVAASLIVPAVLLPAQAWAAQVGCFVTAMFLGIMFLVGLGITAFAKHFLAKYVWKVPRTPWLRFFGITWLELLLGILVFALIRTSFWLTVLIYLPFASLVNRALLARLRGPIDTPVTLLQRYGIFLLLPAALPLSIQVAGVLWSTITNLITFSDLHM